MELPLFPLNTVLFPGATLPLHIFEDRYKQMIEDCLRDKRPFGVVLIRKGSEVGDEAAEPFHVGTTAHIARVERLAEGRLNLICLGGKRFRLKAITSHEPYLAGEVEIIEPEAEDEARSRDLAMKARELFAEYVRLNLALANQWARGVETPSDPERLADYIGGRLGVDLWTKQRLLEQTSASMRLAAEVEVVMEAIRQLTPRVDAARTARWLGFGVMN